MAERSRGLAADPAVPTPRGGAAKKAPTAKKTTTKRTSSTPEDLETSTRPAKKASGATKAAGRQAPAQKPAAKQAAPKKAAVKKAAPKKAAPKKAAARKSAAKKAPGAKKAAPGAGGRSAAPAGAQPPPVPLPVREEESPWTERELAEVRAEIESEVQRLQAEIAAADVQISELIRDSGDGAGDDPADSGAKAFEREHEMTLANNAREALAQDERALDRIDAGTYGTCEGCGQPIGKRRLQAFPRASLCISCKQKEHRH